jgi:hypothetical protein
MRTFADAAGKQDARPRVAGDEIDRFGAFLVRHDALCRGDERLSFDDGLRRHGHDAI